jgi:hypothetical protein
MSRDRLQSINACAEVRDDDDQITEGLRQRAIDLAHAGLPLSAKEMALIFRMDVSTFHKKAKLGAFDDFRLRPALGTKHFSGARVARHLNGEVLEPPARHFGRTRKAS